MAGYRTMPTFDSSGSDIQIAPGSGPYAQFERRIPIPDYTFDTMPTKNTSIDIPKLDTSDISKQIADANAQINAEIARARQQANDTARLFQAARAEAGAARNAALAETAALQAQIQSQWAAHKVDVNTLVGDFSEKMESAIGMMSVAAQRGAEYQMMQLSTLAATGKLGANPFAVQRQMSRAAGDVIGSVMGVMGQMQAKLAEGAAQLTLQGTQINAQLFSQTMSTLAGLVGINADIQMKYAGLVGNLYSNQAGVIVEFAKINANLVGLKIGNIMDGVKIQADLKKYEADFQVRILLAEMEIAHKERMQESEFRFREDMQHLTYQQELDMMGAKMDLQKDYELWQMNMMSDLLPGNEKDDNIEGFIEEAMSFMKETMGQITKQGKDTEKTNPEKAVDNSGQQYLTPQRWRT